MKPQPVSVELARSAFSEFSKDFPNVNNSERFELFTAYCELRSFEVDFPALESGRCGKGKDGG